MVLGAKAVMVIFNLNDSKVNGGWMNVANVVDFVIVVWQQRAFCAYCSDRIWGLGRQGYKCVDCKLHVHKKCHKRIKLTCGTNTVCCLMSSLCGNKGATQLSVYVMLPYVNLCVAFYVFI